MAIRSLLTVPQFAKKHAAFSAGGLRWQIFNEEKNGMKETGVIVRLGRKVLIDGARFFEWLDAQNGFPAQAA